MKREGREGKEKDGSGEEGREGEGFRHGCWGMDAPGSVDSLKGRY